MPKSDAPREPITRDRFYDDLRRVARPMKKTVLAADVVANDCVYAIEGLALDRPRIVDDYTRGPDAVTFVWLGGGELTVPKYVSVEVDAR